VQVRQSHMSNPEFVLCVGPIGTTATGLPNLNTIAVDVGRAIVKRGGHTYFQMVSVTAPHVATPYLKVVSEHGMLEAGCTTMNALLEIAWQTNVQPHDLDQRYLSIYARHPSAEIPKALLLLERAPKPQKRPQPVEDAVPHRRERYGIEVDTDAEQEDILQRIHHIQRRGRAPPTPADEGADEEGRGGDQDAADHVAVVAGLGRRQKRTVTARRRKRRLFGNDPSFGQLYGSAYMMEEPSDNENDVLVRAGFARGGSEAESESDQQESDSDHERDMPEVTVPKEFDPDYELGLSRQPRNARSVVLTSIPQSQVVTRDKKRLEDMIKQEAQMRKQQTERIRSMYMSDQVKHGRQQLQGPVNERRMIKGDVDIKESQQQADRERELWETKQKRRIPREFRDDTGQTFQKYAGKRQVDESKLVRKLGARDMLEMQKEIGSQRVRMNKQLWMPDRGDDDDDDDDARQWPKGMPRRLMGVDRITEDDDDDNGLLHEKGFGLSDVDSDSDADAADQVPIPPRGGRASESKRAHISSVLYSGPGAAAGTEDTDSDFDM
jgi:hypothetical protein